MSKSYSYRWASFWRLCSLVIIFAAVLSTSVTANELTERQQELQSLKFSMLRQISYCAKLSELLTEQSLSLKTFSLLIEGLKKSEATLTQKLLALEQQLMVSKDSTTSLRLELIALEILLEQSTQKHEELLISWNAYRDEMRAQVREIQGERDRARAWVKRFIWVIVGALGGSFALGAAVF